ncbi:MAG: hypothetical protein ACMXYM_02105 [Candidatus Woesearchaeota archaeon]
MVQKSAYAVRFWDTIDQMRNEIFTEEDLELLEAIKPSERFEEHIARL